MREVWFAIPGDLDTPTGGYAYDRRLIAELPAQGWTAKPLILPGNYPNPSPDDLALVERTLAGLPKGALVLADGLLFGALPEPFIRRFPVRWVALVHHPLAYETGLTAEATEFLRNNERAALALTRSVVTTSRMTADLLRQEFGVPDDRLSVAEPGQDPVVRFVTQPPHPPLSPLKGERVEEAWRGEAEPSRSWVRGLQILTVGSVIPRKNHCGLIEALALLKDLRWHCTIAGSLDRDLAETNRLRAAIARHGLQDRIELAGALNEAGLGQAYAAADLYISSASYEGYGMALAAAVAHGLPIVACAGGAVGDTMPAGAGRLVPVDDVPALAAAIGDLLRDPGRRAAHASAAWNAASSLPRWTDTAAAVATVLENIAS